MNEDRKKVSSEQLSILIEALENEPALHTAKGCPRNNKILYVEKWQELARKLNSVDNGALKNVTKWQQAWRDWKSNTKKKAVKVASEGAGQELTSLELRVLNLCDKDSANLKQEGIDINNIVEIDPLSSDDDSCDDHDKRAITPELLTLYTNDVKRENGKRSSSDDEAVNITRKRTKMFADDNHAKLTEIASHLVSLEATRLESDKQQTKILQDMASAMDRQASAAERQADVMTRIIEFLERRDGDG